MADDTKEVELLIALVESRPVLWDKSLENYRNIVATKAAWLEVFRKLNEDYEELSQREQETFSKEVLKRWSNMRDAYVKSLKKNRKYVYGGQLHFLNRLYEEKEQPDAQEDDDKEVEEESSSHRKDYLMDINTEKLIGLVEKWPCLWDKSLSIYKERNHTKAAWTKVVRDMNPDFDLLDDYDQEQYRKEIIKKWNNMRDTFAKSLKKSANTGPFKHRKYVYADQLHFLRRFYTAYDESDGYTGEEDWKNEVMDDTMEVLPDPPDVVLHENIGEAVSLPTYDAKHTHIELTYENPMAQFAQSGAPSSKRRKRQDQTDEVDQKIVGLLDRIEPDNRHISFFKGIVPYLEAFNDDQVLHFQLQVLQLIADMRKRSKGNPPDHSTTHPKKSKDKPRLQKTTESKTEEAEGSISPESSECSNSSE